MDQPPILPYATPSARRPMVWGAHLSVAAAVSVSMAIFLGAAVFVVPMFVGIFRDFKTELPGITQFTIALSDGLRGWGWGAVVGLAAALVAGGMALDARCDDDRPIRRYARIVALLLMLANAIWVAMLAISLLAPMYSLMNSVSGSK